MGASAHDVVTYVGPGPAGPVAGPWVQLEAQRLPQPVSEGETGELHGPQHGQKKAPARDSTRESGIGMRVNPAQISGSADSEQPIFFICESALKPKSFFGIEC